MQLPKKYIPALDTLRGIAAMLVVFHHFGPQTTRPSVNFFFQRMLPDGAFAVDLFFVLSGFLITGVLLDDREKNGSGPIMRLARNFIFRRAIRLMPIYFVLLAVLYFFNYPEIRENIFYYSTYTSNFLSIQQQRWTTFSHTWSLSVEEQFYLVWPFVILFTPKRKLVVVLLFFILLGVVSSLLTDPRIVPAAGRYFGDFAAVFTLNTFHAFAAGGLLAYGKRHQRIHQITKKVLFVLLPLAVVLYILVKFFQSDSLRFAVQIRTIHVILSVAIIAAVVKYNESKSFIRHFLHNRYLIGLGKISYGIYLYHYVIGIAATHFLDPRLHPNSPFKQHYQLSIFIYAATIIVSYLSYHLFEKYVLQLKDYFSVSNRQLQPAFSPTPKIRWLKWPIGAKKMKP